MEAITTENAPAAVGPYSQAVRTGNLLFVSGQLPIDPKTGKMQEDMLHQMQQCLENVEAIALAAGTSLSKTVKTTVLVTDLSRFNDFNEVYGRAFKAPYPARACYEVSALPRGAMVEIEAVIALD
ncbi:2-iminobutanoate/2-iminopropanoate deaminase [Neorhizobium galegae]|uniref:RidA family protein n=1 Tax=Neorhizobium galegae TaxID=399 RepID=UPI001AEA68EB|nr:RidA family protein [Neorhizobium galegae]MBP2562489.1 2-iminobutanoate/2-iminopropanoate deaminase [Neorhizobium galegae]